MTIDTNAPKPPAANRWRRVLKTLVLLALAFGIVLGIALAYRFTRDEAVTYTPIEEHFKYGSTGGEHESGFPYWIFQAMPRVCGKYLPAGAPPGYASVGMLFEKDHSLPVGMSQRSYQGVDRTFLNCAVCHTGSVRDAPGAEPTYYSGMPANTFDLMKFQRFIFACGKDAKFSKEYLVPEVAALMKEQGEKLGLLDRYLVYPVAVWIMRERLITLSERFKWTDTQRDWGPGRVDTFNSAKTLFNFRVHELPERELDAGSDFPSIWLQKPRKDRNMQLHWDGNNTEVIERNKSAAFGTGTTPPTLDLKAVGRIETWLETATPPPYKYAIDTTKAGRGGQTYRHYCASCHGASGRDFSGDLVGKVTPIEAIGTDRHRLDSYSYELAVTQSTLYAGYDWRFRHFRKTFGYSNLPLDGLWLRAPYLHNGSVPDLRSLLDPAAARPKTFYRGDDVYDRERVGFRSTVATDRGTTFFLYDTSAPGNSNAGHEGPAYGTQLSPTEKDELVEFLKTF
jgi:hypothetical protein